MLFLFRMLDLDLDLDFDVFEGVIVELCFLRVTCSNSISSGT